MSPQTKMYAKRNVSRRWAPYTTPGTRVHTYAPMRVPIRNGPEISANIVGSPKFDTLGTSMHTLWNLRTVRGSLALCKLRTSHRDRFGASTFVSARSSALLPRTIAYGRLRLALLRQKKQIFFFAA
eukprot:124536-Rhodomonas_salina.1